MPGEVGLYDMKETINRHSQVVSEIAAHDLCVGCGVCAACCPSGNLEMAWCDNGDLAPLARGECPSGCRVCTLVCPFGEGSASEDELARDRFSAFPGVSRDPEIGYWLEAFVGYSRVEGHRERGSSGGMASWLLETMMAEGRVDAVVCVGETNAPDRLFTYRILDRVEDIRAAAGSRYYPVDLAEVVARMNSRGPERRYAVVGLPCFLKGLGLARRALPRLRRRIPYTIGLTCGHLPNRFYTEHLARLSGISPRELVSAQYRRKEHTRQAGNYHFRARAADGRVGADVPFSRIAHIWSDGYFQLNACNYCDDVFAETADISLMDAWLPEHRQDPKGHSLLVVRHPDVSALLERGRKVDACRLNSIPVARVAESQRGGIFNKTEMLDARLYRARLKGIRAPEKRRSPDKDAYRKHRARIEAHFAIQQASKADWPKLKRKSPAAFRRRFLLTAWPLAWRRLTRRAMRVLKKPSLLARLFRRS